MAICLALVSDSNRSRSSPVVKRRSLLLSGLSQEIFIKEWGEPETQIGLAQLGRYYKLGPMFLIVEPGEEAHHSVWIYKKRDTILFFTRKRLALHFKWSEFREKFERSPEEIDSTPPGMPKSLMATTLALVA